MQKYQSLVVEKTKTSTSKFTRLFYMSAFCIDASVQTLAGAED